MNGDKKKQSGIKHAVYEKGAKLRQGLLAAWVAFWSDQVNRADRFYNRPRILFSSKSGDNGVKDRAVSALFIYSGVVFSLLFNAHPRGDDGASTASISLVVLTAFASLAIYILALWRIPHRIAKHVSSDVIAVALLFVFYWGIAWAFEIPAVWNVPLFVTAVATFSLCFTFPLALLFRFRNVEKVHLTRDEDLADADSSNNGDLDTYRNWNRSKSRSDERGPKPNDLIVVGWITSIVYISTRNLFRTWLPTLEYEDVTASLQIPTLAAAFLGVAGLFVLANSNGDREVRKSFAGFFNGLGYMLTGNFITSFLSILTIAIATLLILRVHYVSYLFNTDAVLILGPIISLYFSLWFHDYWMSRTLGLTLVDRFGHTNDEVIAASRISSNGDLFSFAGWIRHNEYQDRSAPDRRYLVGPRYLFISLTLIAFLVASGRVALPSAIDTWSLDLPEKSLISTNIYVKGSEFSQGSVSGDREEDAPAQELGNQKDAFSEVGEFDLADEVCDFAENQIYIAASGGGSRAALNTYYVLRALHEMGLSNTIALISGVSGGTAAQAYFAAHRNSLQNDTTGKAWDVFREAISSSMIQGVVRQISDWDVVAATHFEDGVNMRSKTMTSLLAEQLRARLSLTKQDQLSGQSGLGLIFNTTLAYECVETDKPIVRTLCSQTKTSGGGKFSGHGVVFSNLRDDLSTDKHILYDIKGKGIDLATASALSGNFPPLFEEAPIEARVSVGAPLKKFYLTDGGVVENRGMLSLLVALKQALHREGQDCFSGKRFSILEIDSDSRREDSPAVRFGIGALFGAKSQFADSRINELLDEVTTEANLRNASVFYHRFTLPKPVFKALGTHWQLPALRDRKVRLEDNLEVQINIADYLAVVYGLGSGASSQFRELITKTECTDRRFWGPWNSFAASNSSSMGPPNGYKKCGYAKVQYGVVNGSGGAIEARFTYEGSRIHVASCRTDNCTMYVPTELLDEVTDINGFLDFSVGRQVLTIEARPDEGFRTDTSGWVSCPNFEATTARRDFCFEFEEVEAPPLEGPPVKMIIQLKSDGTIYVPESGDNGKIPLTADSGLTAFSNSETCTSHAPCFLEAGASIRAVANVDVNEIYSPHIFAGWYGIESCGTDCTTTSGDQLVVAKSVPRSYYFPIGENTLAYDQEFELRNAVEVYSNLGGAPDNTVVVGYSDTTGPSVDANWSLGCARAEAIAKRLRIPLANTRSAGPVKCLSDSKACRRENRRASLFMHAKALENKVLKKCPHRPAIARAGAIQSLTTIPRLATRERRRTNSAGTVN